MFRIRAAAAFVALALAAPAAAQVPLPDVRVRPDARADFRLCRAAIFVHLAAPDSETRLVTKAYAEALREQVALIMFETMRTAPARTMEEGRRVVDFAETFFLGFSKTLAEEGDRLADPETRERLLIDCQPFLWRVLGERIDYLMEWREATIGAPPPPALPEGGEAAGLQRP